MRCFCNKNKNQPAAFFYILIASFGTRHPLVYIDYFPRYK